MRKIDLVGKKFGRWEVIAPADRTYQTMWQCRCECGTERAVSGANLATGHSVSCGCFRADHRRKQNKRRDYRGVKNPRAARAFRIYGEAYIPSSEVWYKRAAGVFHSAKRNGVKIGFKNAQELAIYVKNIAPKKCPVFGTAFVERGSGFHKWSPSIDKKDPKKGYVPGNIQIISMMANCMKRDASADELLAFAAWIIKGT